MSRVFAIGDIHGCYTALQTLLQVVPLTLQDRLITLGDYLDRGPDSRQVVEWVIERTQKQQCIPLRGNHEVMLLDALQGNIPLSTWIRFGGREALQSYSQDRRSLNPEEIPVEHLRFLDHDLLPGFETEHHLFVHGYLNSRLPLSQQNPDELYWRRFEEIQPHVSGKIVVCGHTAQKSGLPKHRGHAICIDTWVYGNGWLTCLDVESGQYWQANQSGKSRTDWLVPPDPG